jgi:hypothetical protein
MQIIRTERLNQPNRRRIDAIAAIYHRSPWLCSLGGAPKSFGGNPKTWAGRPCYEPISADDKQIMPMLVILGIGGTLCGWSLLLIFSGERQRRLAEPAPGIPPVKQNNKN